MKTTGLILGLFTSAIAALPHTFLHSRSNNGTYLPDFLTNNPLPNGYPWGSLTAANTNPITTSPNTGVVRHYDFSITRQTLAPDGVSKSMIVVNGQFPGPLIEANWGDIIEVNVTNNIQGPAEGTSVHFHGIPFKDAPWMDGSSSIVQCPLAPGTSYTYRFKASLYGSSWYHAHYSAQYADGLVGPVVVHGPKVLPYDVDVGSIAVSDYSHASYISLVETSLSPSQYPPRIDPDNILINGKNPYPGTTGAGLSTFVFQTGKTHLLRFVNTGGATILQVSIDSHPLTVVAVDFIPITPYNTNVITLAIGQRIDVLVKATASSSSSFYLRVNASCTGSDTSFRRRSYPYYPGEPTSSSSSSSSNLYALAVILYDKANASSVPTSTPQALTSSTCMGEPISSLVPYYKITPPKAATSQTFQLSAGQNSTGTWLWSVGSLPEHNDDRNPSLLMAKAGNYSFPSQWQIYNVGSNSSYQFIVYNRSPMPHPMHMHGHNMYVLALGTGNWNGVISNPSNPTRRDVQIVAPGGYLVVQMDADNPGIWSFHCHIAWHLSAGMGIQVMERPADILNLGIPSSQSSQCQAWTAWGQAQLDSGL